MKTAYKYIRFEKCETSNIEWWCYNKRSGHIIAVVEWEKRWKEYVFVFGQDTQWSRGCMQDADAFIAQLEPPEGS